MKFGFVMFPTQDAIPPGDLGVLLEDRGFESLFMPDHTHIPASTPEHFDVMNLAPEFKHGMDAFVALGAIAQAAETLQIGTAVLLVTERDPIVTAKEVASVDILSGGRMNFGVGPGWINQEMRNHGTDPDTRWKVMRERVEAMRQIWTNDIASYHGDFVDFDRITSLPNHHPAHHPYNGCDLGNGRSARFFAQSGLHRTTAREIRTPGSQPLAGQPDLAAGGPPCAVKVVARQPRPSDQVADGRLGSGWGVSTSAGAAVAARGSGPCGGRAFGLRRTRRACHGLPSQPESSGGRSGRRSSGLPRTPLRRPVHPAQLAGVRAVLRSAHPRPVGAPAPGRVRDRRGDRAEGAPGAARGWTHLHGTRARVVRRTPPAAG